MIVSQIISRITLPPKTLSDIYYQVFEGFLSLEFLNDFFLIDINTICIFLT